MQRLASAYTTFAHALPGGFVRLPGSTPSGSASGKVWFVTSGFECRACKLRPNSMAEAQAAGLGRYEVESVDASKYEGSAS